VQFNQQYFFPQSPSEATTEAEEEEDPGIERDLSDIEEEEEQADNLLASPGNTPDHSPPHSPPPSPLLQPVVVPLPPPPPQHRIMNRQTGITVPQYNHALDPMEWYVAIKAQCTLHGLDEAATAGFAALMLPQDMRTQCLALAANFDTHAHFTAWLLAQVNANGAARETARRRLHHFKIQLTQDLEEVKRNVNRLFTQGHVNEVVDKLAYLMGMIEDDLYEIVFGRNPLSVNAFFDVLQVLKDRRLGRAAMANPTSFFPPAMSQEQVTIPWPTVQETLAHQASNFGLARNAPSRARTPPASANPTDQMQALLDGMKDMTAHLMQVSNNLSQRRQASPQRTYRPMQIYDSQRTCYNCNQSGHVSRDCQARRN